MKKYSAGIVTAYGSAKAGGYTGTYAEFCAALGDLANVLEDFEGFSVEVSTLAEGESATASYSDGVLSLGIPKGDTGEKPMTEINTLSARMDTFTHLAEGSTTGDAELTDIRVGSDGTTYTTAGAAVRSQISDLKSNLNEITEYTSNRFDTSKITANQYIAQDGTATASQNFSVTDYIPVSEGELIYFKCRRTDSTFYQFDARFLCAYDANKTAVSASGGAFVGGSYTVPSGIAYIRLSISNTYLSQWSDFYIGTVDVDSTTYEPYEKVLKIPDDITSAIAENTEAIAENTEAIAENTATLENITKQSSNLLDVNAITPNTYIPTDGTPAAIATLSATDYLPVSEGDVIYGWGKTNGAYTAITYRFVCAYDSSKNPIPASGRGSESNPPYTVPSGVAYIRLTLRNEALSYDNLYIGTHAVGVDYEPYGLIIKTTGADKDAVHTISDGDSILEAVKYCYENDIKNLVVEAGTYDIIAEYEDYYGSTYFDDYIDYAQGDIFDAGIWLQNINVKFSAGAKVVCHYTGNNANVPLYFSAFATGNNVTIDGLVLDAENLRYGIHADYNTGDTETYFTVKNCDLKHYKNATSMQAIGAGFGKHVFWLIENTIFRSAGGNHIVFRVHNNVDSDAQSKLIVKDCYIDGDGYFQFNAYSTSTLQTIIQVCGCSYKTAPVVGKETSASNDNFTMIAWNNEIRPT